MAIVASALVFRHAPAVAPVSGETDAVSRSTATALSSQAEATTSPRTVGDLLALLGHREPTTFLLLYLNNTELRPGGGFLGTYGVATIHRGSLAAFRTDDVYALDRAVVGRQRIPPPEPFRRYGIVPYWYLRDANWSPDFPTSTRTVLDFYRREGGAGDPSVVIGFTPTFIASLLDLVGPMTVDGISFTPTNVADQLEEQVERAYAVNGVSEERRKDIIASVSMAVIDRLLALPIAQRHTIEERFARGIAERQLMLFSERPSLQALFVSFDASGRVADVPPGEDALLVVDANLGGLKTDPVVERRIRYAVAPDGDGFRGRVEIRYRHRGTFTWKTTRYRTYTRVYLPAGTTLLHADGAMAGDRTSAPGSVDIADEFGRSVFGAFVSVEPGTERTLAFEFRVASGVAERIRAGQYDLVVQKQLGAIAPTLAIDHVFPRVLRSAAPAEQRSAWWDTRYEVTTDLGVDRAFSVRLAQ